MPHFYQSEVAHSGEDPDQLLTAFHRVWDVLASASPDSPFYVPPIYEHGVMGGLIEDVVEEIHSR